MNMQSIQLFEKKMPHFDLYGDEVYVLKWNNCIPPPLFLHNNTILPLWKLQCIVLLLPS